MSPSLVCGLKLTHDGSVAVVERTADRSRLLFSIEAEKVANRARHSSLSELDLVERLLAEEGVDANEVDVFVVDGWGSSAANEGIAVPGSNRVRTAPYRQGDDQAPPLHRYSPKGELMLGGRPQPYVSYRHVEGHLAAAYLTSAAAAEGLPAFVLVWDGGVDPELYHVDPRGSGVEYLGPLFRLRGEVYSGFATRFAPFLADPGWDEERHRAFHLAVPGKAMAYAGLGQIDEQATAAMSMAMSAALAAPENGPRIFASSFVHHPAAAGLETADALATFQDYLGRMLVHSLGEACARTGRETTDLCFAGGCALNIKWNSALRASGLFDRVWVPPFPNDSGSAIGAACAELLASGPPAPLRWSVYCGPRLERPQSVDGWRRESCPVERLAAILADSGEPVVCLLGRAEAGPRALGHRSILAAPWGAGTKDRLNRIKGREGYRPVAPICLEEEAPGVFEPGTPDPYMLFDHRVRAEWAARLPAVVHVDGTARLQTVSARQSPLLARLLRAFFARTGVPVLCNTSANRAGCGFFPDAASAMRWGGVDRVWSDGSLYFRDGAGAASR